MSADTAAPSEAVKRPDVLFGTAFLTAATVMGILSLVGAYLAERTSFGSEWLAENTIPLTQPNMQMAALLMSVVTVHWAVYAIRNNDRTSTAIAYGATVILGAAFINQSIFLFKLTGITGAQPEGPLFYAVTGAHIAMAIVAIVMVVLVALRTLAGQYSSRNSSVLSAVALFWDAMVAVYAVIWIAVYVMK